MSGDKAHTHDIQPDLYRAPEVILRQPWPYKVDVWIWAAWYVLNTSKRKKTKLVFKN